MSATSPHLQEITAAVIAGAHPVVTGTVGDLVVVDGGVRTQRHGIAGALRAAGIEHVLSFDPGDGFGPPAARTAVRAMLAGTGGDTDPDVLLESRSALDVAEVAATLLTRADAPTAVVIYDADVLLGDSDPATLRAIVVLRSAAQNAVCVPRDVPVPPRNTLVVVRGAGELPPALETLPGVRGIVVGLPAERERRAALESLGPHFHGAGMLTADALSKALDALARRTARLPLVVLDQIRRASVDRGIAVDCTRSLVETLRGSPEDCRAAVDVGRFAHVLRSAIVGQDHVLDSIIDRISLRGFSDAMYDPDGTTGRPEFFVLLGSPGGGKTDLAQRIALALFGSPDLAFVIRGNSMKLDHETASITGAPAGYTGYRDGQSLGEQVAGVEEFVLLVDEFDRANRNVLEMLLSVFEEGCLPTSRSTVVDMRRCIVILTSNVGSTELLAEIARGVVPSRQEVVRLHTDALENVLTSATPPDGRNIAALWSRVKNHVHVYDVLRTEAVGALSDKFADWVVVNAAHSWPLTVGYDSAGLAAAVRRRLGREGTWDAREVRAQVDALLHDPLRRALVTSEVAPGSVANVTYPDGWPSINGRGVARAA